MITFDTIGNEEIAAGFWKDFLNGMSTELHHLWSLNRTGSTSILETKVLVLERRLLGLYHNFYLS